MALARGQYTVPYILVTGVGEDFRGALLAPFWVDVLHHDTLAHMQQQSKKRKYRTPHDVMIEVVGEFILPHQAVT